jgi:hypothetical protein
MPLESGHFNSITINKSSRHAMDYNENSEACLKSKLGVMETGL